MMATIREFHSRLKSLDLNTVAEEAVFIHRDAIVQLNKDQMSKGVKSDGNEIQPDYTIGYALFKSSLQTYKAPFQTPNLELTGAFKNGMQIDMMGNGKYEITSDDDKTSDLEKLYTPQIFGLAPSNIEIMKKRVTKTFLNIVKAKTVK